VARADAQVKRRRRTATAAGRPHPPALGASHPRIQPEHGWLWRLRWGVRLCLLALAAEMCYALLTSPRFAIRTVELRGDENVCRELAERVQLPPGTNYFRAPTERLAQMLAGFPSVRAVRVTRDFPSRLVVTVQRREPMAVIRDGERALLVDAQGVIYTIRNEMGWGLPELVAPHLNLREAGAREAKAEAAALAAVLNALAPHPQLGVTQLRLESNGEVTAMLESGAEVKLGGREQLAEKVNLLVAVLRRIAPERIATLDLSDPDGAYWRPKEASGRARVEVE